MRRKKRLIPTLILTVILWAALGYFVYSFSPNTPLPLPILIDPKIIFFLMLFLALFLSFSLLFNNTRRGILLALGIVSIVLLRFFQLFHALYIVFVISILITIEIYFLKR